ncbi:biopolymer transporter ExbD [Aquibium sp. A9E412]|uniref:ExbD/TolR family protein n=1 Tax=Aquibium sp. A9E412 TaxID=2976767 RepID=UPI0025B08988|nr:biopolymer transporter ExbD [Aquibium sp. A9E412]MDN2566933.1 biopolymer transporter ExbD [Aquibium sp. A9E412]
MMRITRPQPARRRESTVALINIVFLMLIFFLIAGTLAPPLDPEVQPAHTADAAPAGPPDALFVTREGALRIGGRPTTVAAVAAAHGGAGDGETPVRLVPDRALPAVALVELIAELRAAGIADIAVVTERRRP